jgi:hypothetical protein
MTRPIRSYLLPILLLLAASAAAARGLPAATIPAPSALCRAAILSAERSTHVPDRLLDAIAMVESGRRDPVSGAAYPWPWTINVEGQGHFYDTKAEVIAAVKAFQAQGARSIDVGCMQVSLLYHPDAFSSLEQAFDPVVNAAYGARFLVQLFAQTNAWPLAAAGYHSLTPDIGADYAKKVLAAWGVPQLPVGTQAITNGPPVSPLAPQPSPGGSPARVAVLLPNGSGAPRVLPMPGLAAAPGVAGRGLDAYRAMPVAMGGLRFPRAS